ncbi:MAG: hypothetical protein RLN70_13240, partial [Rhodospirillaceae bacterium]
MKKSQLYTLGGALLASTAMSGVAHAGSVGTIAMNLGANGSSISSTTQNIANTLFSTTAATANALAFRGGSDSGTGAGHVAVSFENSFTVSSLVNVTLNVTGGRIVTTSAPTIVGLLRHNGATSTFTTTVGSVCSSTNILINQILLSSCEISASLTAAIGVSATATFFGGLQLSGLTFNNASGLASADATISLSGTVNDNANPAIIIENISSGAIVTSRAPISSVVAAGTSGTTNPATTPAAFTNFSAPVANAVTLALATVTITGNGALGTDLATAVSPSGNAGGTQAASNTLFVTVSSSTLSDDATSRARLTNASDAGTASSTLITPAALTGGSVTF